MSHPAAIEFISCKQTLVKKSHISPKKEMLKDAKK